MPWENTEKSITSSHRTPEEFEGILKVIPLDEKIGIQAVVGKPKGKNTVEIQSYLFSKDKGWTMDKAKEWFNQHYDPGKDVIYAGIPFTIAEKIMDQPLRIRGLAMTSGISRNLNIYTPQELEAFAGKLVDAPVYIEHVTAASSVGKVVKTAWDGQNLSYEAEIFDEETAAKIRQGLIRHVSIGADYETIDLINGKIPHGLYNAEMSLVAVPGIPETNIQVLEKLEPLETESAANQSYGNISEALIKKPSEPTISISQAVKIIENVLPSPLVQRSWSLGPQRMCQELRRAILKLHSLQESHIDDRK